MSLVDVLWWQLGQSQEYKDWAIREASIERHVLEIMGEATQPVMATGCHWKGHGRVTIASPTTTGTSSNLPHFTKGAGDSGTKHKFFMMKQMMKGKEYREYIIDWKYRMWQTQVAAGVEGELYWNDE